MLHTMFVKAGACVVNDVLQHCALEMTACDNANDFVSSHILMTTNDVVGAECLGQTGLVNVGRCESDNQHCASTASSCTYPEHFTPFAPECTVQDPQPMANGVTTTSTLYGACYESSDINNDVPQDPSATIPPTDNDKITCLWNKAAGCNQPAKVDDSPVQQARLWFEAANVEVFTGHTCGCEDVVTGACMADHGNYYCAVSANGCDADTEFIPAADLPGLGMECRLCDSDQPIGVPPTPAPVAVNNKMPTANPTVTNRAPFSRAPVAVADTVGNGTLPSDTSDNGSAILLGVLVSLVLVVAIAIILVVVHWFKSRSSKGKITNGTSSANGNTKTTEGLAVEHDEELEFQGTSSKAFT